MILLQVLEGSERMREVDPHGFTLSIVAVMVVFTALLVLFILYTLSGNIFTGKYKRKPHKQQPDADTAAAIGLALNLYTSAGDEEIAAISTALHLYLSESVHDTEPGIITIRRDVPSSWGDKSLTLRKKPNIK